jgi:ppGpp synthetase/RelA/SpoT-type nucleotidyltranferase
MLPYEEIWAILKQITLNSPWFNGNKKVRGFDEELFLELVQQIDDYYISTYNYPPQIDDLVWDIPGIDFTYRYKAASSIQLKLNRLTMTKPLHKVANDILGLRFVFKTDTDTLKKLAEEFVTHCPFGEDACLIIDQTIGKKRDDGYKGIHINIRPNNTVFPIEIQFWTRTHSLLNEYLHANIYKMDDIDLNQYALDLRNWLESVPQIPESDGIRVQSYVDFIYEKAFSIEDGVLTEDEFDDLLDDDEDYLFSAFKEVKDDEK